MLNGPPIEFLIIKIATLKVLFLRSITLSEGIEILYRYISHIKIVTPNELALNVLAFKPTQNLFGVPHVELEKVNKTMKSI